MNILIFGFGLNRFLNVAFPFSLKKAATQHKTELKHLGTVVINDLKSLKVR